MKEKNQQIVSLPKPTYSSTISVLEALLAQAKQGEITSIVFAFGTRQGGYQTGWTDAALSEPERAAYAIRRLDHEFHRQLDKLLS